MNLPSEFLPSFDEFCKLYEGGLKAPSSIFAYFQRHWTEIFEKAVAHKLEGHFAYGCKGTKGYFIPVTQMDCENHEPADIIHKDLRTGEESSHCNYCKKDIVRAPEKWDLK